MDGAGRRLRDRVVFGLVLFAASSVPFLIAYLSGGRPASRPPEAAGGVVDLRDWDFRRDGPVRLSGEWDFFPGQLLDPAAAVSAVSPLRRSVPDLWKGADAGGVRGRGAGTYRLRVVLPPGAAGLAVRSATASTAFELFADGEPIAAAGVPSADARLARASYAPGVSPALKDKRRGELLLVARVSNHEYRGGGLWRPFVLGVRDDLVAAKRIQDLLALVSCGILVGLAVQHAFIFVLMRPARSSLYFALFALTIALRSLTTGEYLLAALFPGIPFDLLIRLEYVSAYLPIPLAAHFIASEAGRRRPTPVLFLSALFIALIPWAPLPLLTRSILAYYPVALFSIVYVFAAIILPSVRGRTENARTVLSGFVIIASAGLNDMLFASFLVGTGNLIPYALVVFVCILSFALASRYTRAYRQIETLLAEKETFLKEMHHRIKNSLQIVSSVTAMQSHRVGERPAAALFAAMNDRIRAVALVHEKLYAAPASGCVDLGPYVADLVRQTARSNGAAAGGGPEILVGPDPISVPIEVCVDFGLALTEILLNAYKHGGGPRSVELRREGDSATVVVRDAGPGFSAEAIPGAGDTLGFKIVSSVVRRHGGTFSTVTDNGAVVALTMPLAVSAVDPKR
jgi:two-component sensor histidine kinase